MIVSTPLQLTARQMITYKKSFIGEYMFREIYLKKAELKFHQFLNKTKTIHKSGGVNQPRGETAHQFVHKYSRP